ncbi:tRNA pseudouridine(55) synthase TruB [Mycoplasmatota bacterium]|nr:tRNA pseudouridine(55) synthase TruB [Mycoplasmatota bacterium]
MNGILLLNKPKKMTSHDCVNQVRKIFHTKKVGHLGTLDPNVTGVLPLCINDATKIIQFLDKSNKEYIAEVTIGYSTTSEDSSGEIVEKNDDLKSISREQLLDVLNSFLGKQIQIPPMISSVKVNGKKLYEYARQNIEVERPKRTIEVYDIELLSQEDNFTGKEVSFNVRIHCSKGTYIRTLAVDIGKKLGYPSHMSDLIRIKSGNFHLNQCYSFDEIKSGNYELISIYDALKSYHMVEVDDILRKKITHGQKLTYEIKQFTTIVFCDIFKQVLAVYERDAKDPHMIRPVRVLIGE